MSFLFKKRKRNGAWHQINHFITIIFIYSPENIVFFGLLGGAGGVLSARPLEMRSAYSAGSASSSFSSAESAAAPLGAGVARAASTSFKVKS